MKALIHNGEFKTWLRDDMPEGWSPGAGEQLVDAAFVDTPQPDITGAQVAEEIYSFDAEAVTVTRTWTVRPKTADELRKTWTCLVFIARLLPEEIAGLWTYAPQLMAMLLSAHEIENDNELTVYGLNQAVAGGLITEARKEQLLA